MPHLSNKPPFEQWRDFINQVTQDVKEFNTDNFKNRVPQVRDDLTKLIDLLNQIKAKLSDSN